MYQYFKPLTQESIQKNKEATLSILGITHPELRKVLGVQMSQFAGEQQSFLSSPIIEQMFAWQKAEPTLNELGGNLLNKKLIDVLDNEGNGAYRFNRSYQPYTHQLKSWKSLLEDKKSIVVTSGTGSGKTECFMVPILNDLYEEFLQNEQSLTGVHALFLYPLNALINSQQERLDAWTRNFDRKDAIRYCLYNGNTKEYKSQVSEEQKQRPNQVLTREELRLNPAPILVTNGTMLEYMMVRQTDAPILQKSKGKLRWIVLDEAHSYMGSQAAELALQLRRVLHAFGVTAQDVRFVATSATIAGKDAEDKLKQFLSEISGQSKDNILVLGGQREVPILPTVEHNYLSLEEIIQIDRDSEVSEERYNLLCGHPIALTLRENITSHRALSLDKLVRITNKLGYKISEMEVLDWIDLLTYTKCYAKEQAFLKVRINYYQRVTHGLWSCINSKCTSKSDDLKNWGFGQVYATHQEKCDCGSPVLELTFCRGCKEPHLLGSLKQGDVLKQWSVEIADEFSLLLDKDEEQDVEYNQSIKNRLLVFSVNENKDKGYRHDELNLDSLKLREKSKNNVDVHYFEPEKWNDPVPCSNAECGAEGSKFDLPFNRAILGAPYYITQVVPHLLQYCPDIEQDEIDEAVKNFSDPEFVEGEFKELKGCTPLDMPAKGKRLITFTDSRQGTARLSVKMQQEAERSRLRGAVVTSLIEKTKDTFQNQNEDPSLKFLREKLKVAMDQNNQIMIDLWQKEIDDLKITNNKSNLIEVTWEDLYTLLAKDFDFKNGILLANRHIAGSVFEDKGSIRLAQMLLTREFSRRPKNANSLETLGLVKVSYKGLNEQNDLPNHWKESGLTIQDWQNFIKVILDFYIRENTVIDLADEWKQWMGGPVRPKHVVSFELRGKIEKNKDGSKNNSILVWPLASETPNHRLVKLLVLGANLDLSLKQHKNIADDWLKKAWKVLTTEFLTDDGNNRYHLRKEKFTFSLMDKVFLCPITHRLMDTTFKGLTPYLPRSLPKNKERYLTKSLAFPKLWTYSLQNFNELKEDPDLQLLRSLNLWTDLSDSAVLGGFFYRTAEHSAQQSASLLKQYETYFKAGKVNVLNCSTTMEMGVDIGGISTVVMNNVPPHPANYLQRTGRAGRGSQSRAISYTLCKNNPHDLQVFNNSLWAYTTPIQAPHVSFNSGRLIQRHINAQLLSTFLIEEIGDTNIDRPKLDLKWFYLKEDGKDSSICEFFEKWLTGVAIKKHQHLIDFLKQGTALKDVDNETILSESLSKIRELKDEWIQEYTVIESEYNKEYSVNSTSSYLFRLEKERDLLLKAYLLSELAMRNFLPSYGFPTDVITFNNTNRIEKERWEKLSKKVRGRNFEKQLDREDNLTRIKGMPSRNIAIAIREYAPGAEVIIDGRVYISKGISLSWQNMQNEHDKKPQRFDHAWVCHHCGQTGLKKGVIAGNESLICSNPECGKEITDIKKVLRPNGFSVDFYDQPNNDVTAQKYIPIQKPWVGISQNVETWPLPNANLGYFNIDTDGYVFQYSSGLNGTGYAICMQCGRADSMEAEQDGEPSYPNTLTPDRPHKPLNAQKEGERYKKPHDCNGSSNVKPNIHLGCQIQTDVLEIILKHPVRNEYILNNEDGKIIATTLVVALRQAIASVLGISTDELGYAVKVKKLDGQAILVLQIYDDLSGGAGFSTTASKFISEILRLLIEKLKCNDETCSSICGQCLLDSQTRHDVENLNRKLALEWLGEDFLKYLESPIPNTEFISGTPFSIIEYYLNQGAKNIIFNLNGSNKDWDILCTEIRKKIFTILNHEINLEIVLSSDINLTLDFQKEMLALEKVGIKFAVKNSAICLDYLYAQVILEDKIISLFNQDNSIFEFNENWLESVSPSYQSMIYPSLEIQPFSFDFNIVEQYENQYHHLKILHKFNDASISGFAQNFWNTVVPIAKLDHLINDDPIVEVKYSDRYLKSPANIILISNLFNYLKNLLEGRVKFIIQTSFFSKTLPTNSKSNDFLDSDFQDHSDHEQFFIRYFEDLLSQKIYLDIPKYKIDHARYFLLKFKSGKEVYVRMDQGVGYWRLKHADDKPHLREKVKFPFAEDIVKQVFWVKGNSQKISVKNGENFATDLYITKN